MWGAYNSGLTFRPIDSTIKLGPAHKTHFRSRREHKGMKSLM